MVSDAPVGAPTAGSRRARRDVLLVALIGGQAAAALGLVLGHVRGMTAPDTPARLTLPALAALFAVAEAGRVHLHFRRNAHSFSLSEIPLVLGLFFASPAELVTARVLGSAAGLALRRQAPRKLAFNLSLVALETAVAVAVFRALAGARPDLGPAGSGAALLAAVSGTVLSLAAVMVAITLSEGMPPAGQVARGVAFSLVATVANGTTALPAVAVAWTRPAVAWLMLVPVGMLALAYTAYTAERQKHQRLQFLYQSSGLLQRTHGDASMVVSLLSELSRIFHTELAEVTLLPGADQSEVTRVTLRGESLTVSRGVTGIEDELAPFRGEGSWPGAILTASGGSPALRDALARRGLRDAVVAGLRSDDRLLGTLAIGQRRGGMGAFQTDEVSLFEALAAQVSVALSSHRLAALLEHQSVHDAVTGLANRALFADRLAHALDRQGPRDRSRVWVLLVDVDDFKVVNDRIGHAGGDRVLRGLAERLSAGVGPSATVARLGADEFGILLEETGDVDRAVAVAEQVNRSLSVPLTVDADEISVHTSIGLARGDADTTASALLAHADLAMYRAKQRGGAGFELYDARLREEVIVRLELKADLERAIAADELTVHYQPIVELVSGKIVGVEALIRWPHRTRGLVPPDHFVPVAEESGLIAPIGRFVLGEACRQAAEWRRAGAELGVSVNVSPRELGAPGYVASVAAVLEETGLDARLLTLEITERCVVESGEVPRSVLAALRLLGVHVAVDDFGTGYSALSTLQDLPVDMLKIAKPFVDGVADDGKRQAFMLAIIRLGRTLGLDLLAEGVETPEQRATLASLGCELAQGYLFGRPVPASGIDALVLPVPAPASSRRVARS